MRHFKLPLSRMLFYAACIALPGAAAAGARPQILVEDAASPWSNHNGEGYANDLVRAAFAAAGVDVELVVVPYARCKALVMQGAAAGCLSMAAAPELGKLVHFADKPLYSVTPRFYYNVEHRATAKSVAAMTRGMRVGVVHGFEYPPFVAALAQRGIVLESARSDVANLRKLAAKRIDFALVLVDDMRSEALIKRQAGVHNVAYGFSGAQQESFIGFSTIHRDGDTWRRSFNAGFQSITENGTRQAIQARWKLRCAEFCEE